MEELRRRMASAKSWGIEPRAPGDAGRDQGARPVHRRVDPARRLLLPDGRRRRLAAARARSCARRRRGRARSRCSRTPRCTASTSSAAAMRGVAHVARRRSRPRRVVIACGVWSPRLAQHGRRAHPAHAAGAPDDRRRPRAALRAVDRRRSSSRSCATWTSSCTSARTASASRSARTRTARSCTTPRRSPPIEEAALSPTEFPFTQDDFDPQMEHALELMPEIVGDESVGVKYAINGLIALTPDGMPILGETPEVKGLWSAAAVWVKEGPGRRQVRWPSGWCTASRTSTCTPPTSAASTRTRRPARTSRRAPSRRSRRPTASSTRPSSTRPTADLRLSPMHDAARGARRRLLRGRRLGAPAVVRGERAARRASTASSRAPARVGRALVVADHQRRAPRDARARRHLRPLGVRDLRHQRPRRARRPAADRDAPDGRPGRPRRLHARCCRPSGGFKSDLTIMRLGDDLFRVVTGGAHGMADRSGSATTCRRTARRRSSTSRRRGRRSACGARARATSSRR